MEYHVSGAAYGGMILSLIIATGLPIALLIILLKKFKAKLSPWFIGAGAFILFALILESIMHNIVLGATGDAITGNIWLYALYGGFAAGIFEETGRLLAMKFLMKKKLTKENALMYGAGHGGIESVILIGFGMISNIMTSMLINAGQLDTILDSVPEEQREAARAQLSQLWDGPAYYFYFSGFERIIAIALHICLSYVVYRSLRDKKPAYFISAILIHAVLDGAMVILLKYTNNNYFIVEGVLFISVAVSAVLTVKAYRNEPETEKPEPIVSDWDFNKEAGE